MNLAFYQPDIPQNLGGGLRLAACFGVEAHIIEPCGFPFDDKRMKRAGMDYIEQARYRRHASWEKFLVWRRQECARSRLVLLTTKASTPYLDFPFGPEDILLLGRESYGVPEEVHQSADARVRIPIASHARSLNMVVAAGIVLAEGLRQQHHTL